MSSIYNGGISISIFGESHGKAIGVVLDNIPCGEKINMELLSSFVEKRAPINNSFCSTKRNETDEFEILSGIESGYTNGFPICAIIYNKDSSSKDYKSISDLMRPGHSDYTSFVKYKGFADIKGGGHLSGRLTAPLVFAGGICEQILSRRNIYCFAHINSIGDIFDLSYDNVNPNIENLKSFMERDFLTIDVKQGELMKDLIRSTSLENDSIGGTIECIIVGLQAGVGSPFFGGLESEFSSFIFSIPAVKGIEFGAGFSSSRLKGSQNNDSFFTQNNKILTKTNNHGGILGGISTGMPINFKVAFKPTPSISQEQNTIDIKKLKNSTIKIDGRHDACIVPRAIYPVIASSYIVVLSSLIKSNLFN